MATSTATAFPVAIAGAPVKVLAGARTNRRRSISLDAGHALEKLGHAIEYLMDEFIREGGTFSPGDAKLQAVELLMAINRQVYDACPEIPTLADRWHAWAEHLKG
jgi:hypothetical protein